jgi:hypothetical protein
MVLLFLAALPFVILLLAVYYLMVIKAVFWLWELIE